MTGMLVMCKTSKLVSIDQFDKTYKELFILILPNSHLEIVSLLISGFHFIKKYQIIMLIYLFYNFKIKLTNFVPMDRAYSFSRTGVSLDKNRQGSLGQKDNQKLSKILRSKSSNSLNKLTVDKRMNLRQDFSRLTSRQTLSSFQKCNYPIQNPNAIYNPKHQITQKNLHHYPMTKYNPPSKFDIQQKYHQTQQICNKFSTISLRKGLLTRNQQIKTTRDLRNIKESHYINFQKQLERPLHKEIRNVQQSINHNINHHNNISHQGNKINRNQQSNKIKKIIKEKLGKTHHFDSYTQRDFFNPENAKKFTSALNSHTLGFDKFRKNSKNTHIQFDKFVDKIATRYDRSVQNQSSKFNYQPKDTILRSSKSLVSFDQQSDRKLNEIHSKYPLRIAF